MKKVLVCLISICLVAAATAQETLQVVTKTIEKTARWKPGYALEINGEKAEVEVSPGTSNDIAIRAELTAKHPNLDTAKIDLENWKFVVSTVGKKIYVRAYVGLKPGQKTPISNLKAKITVLVPATCPVSLANKLGKVRLENLRGPVALNGEFCNFQLIGLGGEIWLESQYGTVEAHDISGNLSMKTNRADVTLSGLRADCSVKSEYGKVVLEADAAAGNLAVVGAKTDVRVKILAESRHNVHLKTEYGELRAPRNFENYTPSDKVKQANLRSGEGHPFVSVETTFGSIVVE